MKSFKYATFLVSCLLFFGLNITADRHPIFKAVEEGDVKELKKLINTDPKVVNFKDEEGNTPLHTLAYQNSFAIGFSGQLDKIDVVSPIAKLLISKGAKLNILNNKGFTPLIISLSNDNVELAKYLIEKGADLNIVYNLGGDEELIIHMASGYGHMEIVKILLNKGININVKTKLGHTLLLLALTDDSEDLAKYLLSKGANIDVFFNSSWAKGWMPIHLAIAYDHFEVTKYFLDKGVNIDIQAKDGNTPLHIAAIYNREEIIEYLLAHNANKNLLNEKGLNPLQAAMEANAQEAIDLLH